MYLNHDKEGEKKNPNHCWISQIACFNIRNNTRFDSTNDSFRWLDSSSVQSYMANMDKITNDDRILNSQYLVFGASRTSSNICRCYNYYYESRRPSVGLCISVYLCLLMMMVMLCLLFFLLLLLYIYLTYSIDWQCHVQSRFFFIRPRSLSKLKASKTAMTWKSA